MDRLGDFMTLRELLDLIKARHNLDTDYKTCKILQVSQSRVSRALKLQSCPDDDLLIKAENLLELPPGTLLLEFHAQSAKTDEAARIYRDLAKKIAP